ncbi:probable receptor-like protein kinase At2g23200 [Argentina anserina]|uniref:probable receptor-like protein kinase At2g23200 n=1 Tax=Argentina anserina TaxID=57926 RepID=UPI0021763CF7|nr:probable receptor-like protein kinase At2g23200 [Potentilla anserina]
MEILDLLLLSQLVLLLQYSSLHSLSLAYELQEKYFVNCGSDDNVDLNDRNFIGDLKPDSFSFSKGSETIKDANLTLSSLYQTARVSSRQSYYKFEITDTGTYLVRLHFFPISSPSSNLSTGIFHVSDSKFRLLNNFTAKINSSTTSAIIKEFFLGINSTDSFKLYFTPQASSFAFVNAIELFLAPSNFTPENHNSNLPLHTTYRVNVGGPELSPNNDTLWRNWETDDIYLSDPNSAKNSNKSTITYAPNDQADRDFIASTKFIAPDLVYKTAKVMNSAANSSNITWSFSVSRNARHIVRAHFCDIISTTAGEIVFNLSSNGNFRKEIVELESRFHRLLSNPFYYDFVVNASESEVVNISIAPNFTIDIPNAFLNGLEILQIMEGTAVIYDLEESKKVNVAIVVGSVLGGGLFLICIFLIGFLFCLRHRKAKKNRGGISHNLGLKISFVEIKSATDDFDPKMQIGVGGFGHVYRGTLSDGTKVAVKRCKQVEQRSGQGLPEFETEIIVLSKIHHRHLVSLIGYCDEGSEMILVYEFMEKGTLEDHLYDSNVPRLSWKQRLEICIGAASGLDYLHRGAAGGIIHRDVKSTNILLDENLVAKVADFGLSKSGPLEENFVSTAVKGTIGYLDPEYYMSGMLTEKSDVYSFGVVLLEVLCGRPPIVQTVPREQMNLAEWVMHCKKQGTLEEIIDSPLKGEIDPSSLRRFIETAEKCLKPDSCDRPTMADVQWDLNYALKLHQTGRLGAPHEDSTVCSSSAFSIPNIPHFASLDSTVNISAMKDDEMESTESEIFSQLRIGEAR